MGRNPKHEEFGSRQTMKYVALRNVCKGYIFKDPLRTFHWFIITTVTLPNAFEITETQPPFPISLQ